MEVEALYIEPGAPWENGYAESFHSRCLDEFLAIEEFESLGAARPLTAAWKEDYNHHRPHSSLGYVHPAEFATRSTAGFPDPNFSSADTENQSRSSSQRRIRFARVGMIWNEVLVRAVVIGHLVIISVQALVAPLNDDLDPTFQGLVQFEAALAFGSTAVFLSLQIVVNLIANTPGRLGFTQWIGSGPVSAFGWWAMVGVVVLFCAMGVLVLIRYSGDDRLRIMSCLHLTWIGIDSFALVLATHFKR